MSKKMTTREYERIVRNLRSEEKHVKYQAMEIETQFGKIWEYAQKHIIPQIQDKVFKMLGTKEIRFIFDYDEIFIVPKEKSITKETWGFIQVIGRDYGVKINWGGEVK